MNAVPILSKIRELGYHVSVFKVRGGISVSGHPLPVPDRYVEMHAVKPGEPVEVHIVRVDKRGAKAECRCARELARLIIVDHFHR